MNRPEPERCSLCRWHLATKGFFPAMLLAFLCLFALCGCPESVEKTSADLAEARSALGRRDFLEAEKAFERYLRANPEGEDRWQVWQNLVELSLNMRGDRKGAIELLEAMLAEYDGDLEKRRVVRMRLAEQYRLSRGYDRAMALWAAATAEEGVPDMLRAGAYRSMAGVYLRRLEFELAKEALNLCLTLRVADPLRGECLYDLAQTHLGMDEPGSAVADLRGVLQLRDIPDSLRTLTIFMLADALAQMGKGAEALELFESIRLSYPNPRVVERHIEALTRQKMKMPAQTPAAARR